MGLAKLCNFINLPTDGSTSAPACYSSNEARKPLLFFLFVAPFLFFASSAASSAADDDDNAAGAANAANAPAAEAARQYLQGAGIRTRDSATTERCATSELQSLLYLHFLTYNNACCTIQLRRHFLFPIDPVPATKLSK